MWDSIRLGLMARKCRKNALPPFICDYLDHRKNKPKGSTPIDNLRFIVYDTETTGLNIHKDRLLSIGSVTVTGDSIITEEAFHRVVHSEYFDYKSAAVHGLTATEVKAGSEVDPALEHFLQTLRADVIVAHHASFDVRMVEQSIRRSYASSFFLYNHILDTAHLAKKLELPDTPKEYIDHSKYTLDSLCERYHISQADRHTAWGDAYITAKLLLILLKRLKARGVNTLGQLF